MMKRSHAQSAQPNERETYRPFGYERMGVRDPSTAHKSEAVKLPNRRENDCQVIAQETKNRDTRGEPRTEWYATK